MTDSKILSELIKNKGKCYHNKYFCEECPFRLLCLGIKVKYLTKFTLLQLSSKDKYDASLKLYSEIYGKESLMELLL